MERWEDFIGRAVTGKLGERVKDAIMAPNRDNIQIVIREAIVFGSLSAEEVAEKYGPPFFR
jgi:hypothetical protein